MGATVVMNGLAVSPNASRLCLSELQCEISCTASKQSLMGIIAYLTGSDAMRPRCVEKSSERCLRRQQEFL
jgi:hypothetical protein